MRIKAKGVAGDSEAGNVKRDQLVARLLAQFNDDDDCLVSDLLESAYRAGAESQREEGWVACAERLPEFSGTYIVAVNGPGDDGEAYVGALPADWSADGKYWHDLRGWGNSEVTHWRPLPQSPKEKQSNG